MTIPPDDRGLLLGDGLFETLLADAGELVCFSAHMDRLAQGCGVLGLPRPDPDEIHALARSALAHAGLGGGRAAVRVTWTAGSGGRGLGRPEELAPRLLVTAAPAPWPKSAAKLATASVRRNEGSPTSRLKTLAYLDSVLARREAQAAGADEALMLNNSGAVACAAAANIVWVKDERLRTPALELGVLAGIVRQQLLAEAKDRGVTVEEGRWGIEALFEADAVFLTNSLIGVRPVASLDGRPLRQQVGQSTVWLLRGRR
jgi:branched-subunit amino acid aminotransferase/4-amino-4-deoxychorismate lyase